MPNPQTREPASEAQIIQPTALQAIQRAEIDSTIATAKNFPRDFKDALKRVKDMATLTEAISEECHYSLPKTDKNGRKINIQGASIRFAEILASQWGNLRIASRVIEVGATQVVAQGICLDLETNVAYDVEVRRSIVSKNGRRFSEDVVITNANACAAVAQRNAVLKAIPRPLWNPIYEATLKKIGGGKQPMAERWQNAVAWFGSRGVEESTLRKAINVEKVSDLKQADIQTLVGWRNAIEEDPTAVEEIFGEVGGQTEESDEASETAPRQAPTEVTAPETGESPETAKAKAKLLTEWRGARKDLGDEEIDEVRRFAGVDLINHDCTLAQLEAVVRKASEIAEGKRE